MSIAIELPTLESLRAEQRALRAELARLHSRLKLQLLLEFAVEAAVALVATGAVLVFLDWWFRFSVPVRVILLLPCLGAALGFLIVRAVRRWQSAGLDELSLAVHLDRYRPGTGQMIADVLQLPGLLDEPGSWASPAMVRLAVRQACEALAASDWRMLWNGERTSLYAAALVTALMVPVGFSVSAPTPPGSASPDGSAARPSAGRRRPTSA